MLHNPITLSQLISMICVPSLFPYAHLFLHSCNPCLCYLEVIYRFSLRTGSLIRNKQPIEQCNITIYTIFELRNIIYRQTSQTIKTFIQTTGSNFIFLFLLAMECAS